MELLRTFFNRLFIVCAAAALCDILAENTFVSGGKGTSAAVKTVCALCVCASVFSFFGNVRGALDSSVFDGLNSAAFSALAADREKTDTSQSVLPLIERTKVLSEKRIADIVFQKYGIIPTNVCIDLTVNQPNDPTTVDVPGISLSFDESVPENVCADIQNDVETQLGLSESR